MKTYYLNPLNPNSDSIIMVVDDLVSFVPKVEGNPDYDDYLAWVAEGNTAEPWEPSTTPEP